MSRAERTARARIVEEARRHVGYRAQPQRRSAFATAPYVGQAWDGTFVDRVLTDAFESAPEVRFISTVAALAYYTRLNRVYSKPRTGDVVFLAFSADPLLPFEQPAVGIVTEVKADGSFLTIEGSAQPGTPQGSQLADGVFARARYATDLLAVVRPKPAPNRHVEPTATVKLSHYQSNPKTRARALESLQRLLNRATGATFNRGKYDGETKSALGRAARENGVVTNRGEIDARALTVLVDKYGEFTVES